MSTTLPPNYEDMLNAMSANYSDLVTALAGKMATGSLTSEDEADLLAQIQQMSEQLGAGSGAAASDGFTDAQTALINSILNSTPSPGTSTTDPTGTGDSTADLYNEMLKNAIKAQNDQSSNSSSLSTGAIVGIVVGAIVVLGLVIGVFVWKRRSRANDKAIVAEIPTPTEGGSTNYSTLKTTGTNVTQGSAASNESDSWADPAIIAVRIPLEKITFGELISRGGYGEVFRGTYQDRGVAIKRLLPERRKDLAQIEAFFTEVKLMSTLEHERVVRFVGVAWDSLSDLCVLTELMEGGDLRTVLNRFETVERRSHGFDFVKVRIAVHVAHALTYLHSLQPVVLHRDLKSRNILLDSQLNAKVTDFGVARERIDSTMTAGVGSSLWMAPEVMLGERYNEKADVFSYGVVLSELDTHVTPYTHATEPGTGRKLPETAILQMVSLGRLRVEFSSSAYPELVELALACVAVNPADRPTAAEVLHRVHQISRSI
ncbi:hypothetical protein Poli38472_011953 [Pythium oligandrum]|uniref:Protein kinase domain-containing protein n=1 Tax=Pythium oligandrum TaxID=41045 RepID=A0A8K1CQJ9_PYTOL|nr:hypothetical protein Poli38472_011953 [Pythium oligandrum]|eukprot:TMW66837.1 hypothetical protein Poli38472_011953 [Pythium oligandrum]